MRLPMFLPDQGGKRSQKCAVGKDGGGWVGTRAKCGGCRRAEGRPRPGELLVIQSGRTVRFGKCAGRKLSTGRESDAPPDREGRRVAGGQVRNAANHYPEARDLGR